MQAMHLVKLLFYLITSWKNYFIRESMRWRLYTQKQIHNRRTVANKYISMQYAYSVSWSFEFFSSNIFVVIVLYFVRFQFFEVKVHWNTRRTTNDRRKKTLFNCVAVFHVYLLNQITIYKYEYIVEIVCSSDDRYIKFCMAT